MAHSLEEGLDAGARLGARTGADEIMIIGGEDVFREVLPQADRIYLTEVHAAPDADTWFPPSICNEWREVSREATPPGPKDDHAFSFVILDRGKLNHDGARQPIARARLAPWECAYNPHRPCRRTAILMRLVLSSSTA